MCVDVVSFAILRAGRAQRARKRGKKRRKGFWSVFLDASPASRQDVLWNAPDTIRIVNLEPLDQPPDVFLPRRLGHTTQDDL